MGIYKRGEFWWLEKVYKGRRYRKTTHFTNKRKAEQYAAAFNTKLALGEMGLEELEPVPPLRIFSQQFVDYVQTRHADKPQTMDFYTKRLRQLLRSELLREVRLDRIDEGVIERYVVSRRQEVSATSVNRELATLRRLLRLAQEWKVIRATPRIHLLRGEGQRDFVLDHGSETRYLALAPSTLRDVATLLLDSGLRVGEALSLCWPDIHLQPAGKARYGWLHVRSGKSRNAKRNVPLTARVSATLRTRQERGNSPWVFPGDAPDRPLLGTSLAHMHTKICRPLSGKKRLYVFPKDFVLHSLRHTCLTRLGEAGTDAFTIMKLAGHSSVTISQRYVHPTPESVERAYDRLEELNRVGLAGVIGEDSPQMTPQPLLVRA